MASGWVVEARGLDELIRALRIVDRKLPGQIVPVAMKRAAERGGYVEAAQREAPVGPSGRTRQSVRILAAQRRVRLVAGGGTAKGGGRRRLQYVPVVHYGWPGHNIEPNRWLERAKDTVGPGPAIKEAGRALAEEISRIGITTTRS